MDESLRNELTAIVVDRARREDLVIRSGELEAAVVRIYRNPKTDCPGRRIPAGSRTTGSGA